MLELSGDASLRIESSQCLLVVSILVQDDFERQWPTKLRVKSADDGPHPSASDLFPELVSPE